MKLRRGDVLENKNTIMDRLKLKYERKKLWQN